MYATKSHQGPTTSDLAARLTDVALEALAGTDTPVDSIDLELTLWHSLQAVLERDRRWQRFLPSRGAAAPRAASRAARRAHDCLCQA